MYNVIIVGSGPAGISAGLYLKRANLNILIISKNDSALNKTEKIENYYGFKSITGEELYRNGLEQLKHLNIELVKDEVVQLNYTHKLFRVDGGGLRLVQFCLQSVQQGG